MSDTPRTDKCTFDVVVKRGDAHLGIQPYKDGSGDFVESEFCKQLERELNEANERIKRLEDIIKRAANRFFADGSDGKTASDMLTILDEAREVKP